MRRSLLSLLAVGVVACGGGGSSTPDAAPIIPDAEPPPDADPASLASTGLCVDSACKTLATGVREYTPRWALWSDAAKKRRWIWLPPGTQIDTTDMNAWVFPVGTKLWKEFVVTGSAGDVRVETRLFTKVAAEDWFRVAYLWNADQTAAMETPLGELDVLGTMHDVPSRRDCGQCHDRVPTGDRVLGFAALQLDYDAPAGQLDLADLVKEGLLTKAPTKPDAQPAFFPLPVEGNADRTKVVQDALGYLHANCGGCHNAKSEIFTSAKAKFDVRMYTDRLARVQDTAAYTTLLGPDGKGGIAAVASIPPFGNEAARRTVLVVPQDPNHSIVLARLRRDVNTIVMPPLATEQKDEAAVKVITDWINGLPK